VLKGAPKKDRFYGLTTEALAYEPPVTKASPLEFERGGVLEA
jgi:hypothetical protein